MAAMSLFTAGTLICALSFSFPALIAGRVVQAAGAGIMMPLMQTVLLLIFPKEKRGSAMGMVGLVIAFAPAVGPTLSGWIVDRYPWEVLFYLLLPFAVIDMIAAHFILKNVTEQTSPKMDVTSIILSSLGFGGILYAFSSAGVAGWTGADVLAGFAVGSVTLFWFIWRQLHLEEPILEFRVFKYPMFTLATIIGMVVFMSMIGAATIVPMYMQDMRHFTAMESGMMLFPGAVVMGLMSPITGRILTKSRADLEHHRFDGDLRDHIALDPSDKDDAFCVFVCRLCDSDGRHGDGAHACYNSRLEPAPAPFDSSRNGHEQYDETDVRIDRDGCSHHHHDTACAGRSCRSVFGYGDDSRRQSGVYDRGRIVGNRIGSLILY